MAGADRQSGVSRPTVRKSVGAGPTTGGRPIGQGMRSDLPPRYRLPLLVLGFIALGLGVEAGLARLGWNVPLPYPGLTALHGPLMVSGFFGTLISLERAVALSKRWAYGAPLFTALGAMALILGAAETPSTILITLGSLVMLSASLSVYRRQRALFTATLALGAAAWLVGNALWVAGLGMAKIVP